MTQVVKQILTKLAVVTKSGKRKGSIYRSPRIYLPTKLTDDSMFPFIGGDRIRIEVDGKRLIVSHAESKRRNLRSRSRRGSRT